MRTILVLLCALLMIIFPLEARKHKGKTPASQKTLVSKQHTKSMKAIAKTRKAPKQKHRQKVN